MEIQTATTNKDIDWEFYAYALDLEKEWQRSLPKFTGKELLDIFPEAKEIIPEKIFDWDEQRIAATKLIKQKLKIIREKSAPNNQWFWREWVKFTDGESLLEAVAHIERLKRLQGLARGAVPRGMITDEQIEQARAEPIEGLIEQSLQKSGKALVGLCPLHNERHPSFYIYPETNSCWCFGCSQGGDAISFVRLLHGLSFKEAVLFLVNN